MKTLISFSVLYFCLGTAAADPTYRPAYDQADAAAAAAQYQSSMSSIVCATCAASAQAIKAIELARWIANCNNPQQTHPVDAPACMAYGQTFLGN